MLVREKYILIIHIMEPITVSVFVEAPRETVWEYWTTPEHIMEWNHASDDWHCPAATNELEADGKFSYTMAANDGSVSFDFSGTHTDVIDHELIESTLDDGRKMSVVFEEENGGTKITETFDPEEENPVEMQQAGWQAILENFKLYVESQMQL